MSPWVRLQENALDHPKLLGFVDLSRPFDLWVWGLSYVQKHLTDGHLPGAAITRKSAKAAAELISRGLWEADGENFIVHDYHDWNESKETVLAKRLGARSRAKKSRDSHDLRAAHDAPHRHAHGAVGSVGRSVSSLEEKKEIRKPSDGSIDQLLADRSARLLEKYAELYAKHRNGARFRRPLGNLEWIEGIEICRVWDDETLHKLIEILLTTDEEWISKTDRGWKIFNARVQWCAERLAQWEADQRRRA